MLECKPTLEENIPLLYRAEIVLKISYPQLKTANGGMNKVLNVNHDQISVLHNLQVTDHISPAITATNLKSVSNTVTRQLSSNHIEKYLVDPALNSQRITENGEEGNNKPWAHNPESSLTDLLPGLSDKTEHFHFSFIKFRSVEALTKATMKKLTQGMNSQSNTKGTTISEEEKARIASS
ncbi:hypothetical protein Tco_1466665 [Tanacetum coccineum]